jgi:hypothetical protein
LGTPLAQSSISDPYKGEIMHHRRTFITGARWANVTRWLIASALIALMLQALSFTGNSTLPQTANAQEQDSQAHLIFITGPTDKDALSTRTPNILKNIDYIESLPFDGMVVDIPAGWLLMEGKPLNYDDIYDPWLAPLEGKFKKFTHNFLRAQVNDPGDVFDDAKWNITIENWRLLARAARQIGFAGIYFDNEEYFNPWLNYPEDYTNPTRSLKEYQAQAQLRGRQIMQAVVQEFPDIDVLFMHGPYITEPKTPSYVKKSQVGGPDGYELHGPLFVGFLEGAGDRATIIDGGEVYQYRTQEDFQHSYDWRKYGMASAKTNSAFIPPAIRAQWPNRVSISYGVYNQTWPTPQDQMNPTIMKSTLANALQRADDYVWFYAEKDTWFVPGGVSQEWIDAVKAARAAVQPPPPTATTIPATTTAVPPTATPTPGVFLPLINKLTLFNAATDQPIGDLKDGATLDLKQLGTNQLSVVATTNPTKVGSVTFALDGQVIQTENYVPYSIKGDAPRTNGRNYLPWTPTAGKHTLVVTPYSQAKGQGQAGTPMQVTFTVAP